MVVIASEDDAHELLHELDGSVRIGEIIARVHGPVELMGID
jgi:hypothetical protein